MPVPQACGSVTQRGRGGRDYPRYIQFSLVLKLFHLPQFLLIKRMNYISVAGSGNLSPLVLSTPWGALLLLRKEQGVLAAPRMRSGGCRRWEDGAKVPCGLGCAPRLSCWGSSQNTASSQVPVAAALVPTRAQTLQMIEINLPRCNPTGQNLSQPEKSRVFTFPGASSCPLRILSSGRSWTVGAEPCWSHGCQGRRTSSSSHRGLWSLLKAPGVTPSHSH